MEMKQGSSPSAPLVLRTHPIVVLASTAAASLLFGFILGVVVAKICRRRSSVSVTSSSVSLVKPGDQLADSESSSTSGENNNLESGKKEESEEKEVTNSSSSRPVKL